MSKNITWIYFKKNYPEVRNIKSLHGQGAEYRRYSLTNIVHAALSRLMPKSDFYKFFYIYFSFKRQNVPHVFNGIVFTRSDWVTTMETFLPRSADVYSLWQLRFALWCLSKNNCKAILAISNRAIEEQRIQLGKWVQQGYLQKSASQRIKGKINLVPPPQKALGRPKARIGEFLRVIFVGNLFFLKGGREAFLACSRIRENHRVNLKFVVISTFESDLWFSKTSKQDEDTWKMKLSRCSWVESLSAIDNEKVLTHIQRSHVSLFPTKRDSYGYFTLESQASGVPVISSDYGAQKEINDSECGWVVPSSDQPTSVDMTLVANLERAILESTNEKLRMKKAFNAYERILQIHDYSEEYLESKIANM